MKASTRAEVTSSLVRSRFSSRRASDRGLPTEHDGIHGHASRTRRALAARWQPARAGTGGWEPARQTGPSGGRRPDHRDRALPPPSGRGTTGAVPATTPSRHRTPRRTPVRCSPSEGPSGHRGGERTLGDLTAPRHLPERQVARGGPQRAQFAGESLDHPVVRIQRLHLAPHRAPRQSDNPSESICPKQYALDNQRPSILAGISLFDDTR